MGGICGITFTDIGMCKGLITKFNYFLKNACFGTDIKEKAKIESKWIFFEYLIQGSTKIIIVQ